MQSSGNGLLTSLGLAAALRFCGGPSSENSGKCQSTGASQARWSSPLARYLPRLSDIISFAPEESFHRLRTVRRKSRPAQLDFLSRPSSSAHVWGPSLNLWNQTDALTVPPPRRCLALGLKALNAGTRLREPQL